MRAGWERDFPGVSQSPASLLMVGHCQLERNSLPLIFPSVGPRVPQWPNQSLLEESRGEPRFYHLPREDRQTNKHAVVSCRLELLTRSLLPLWDQCCCSHGVSARTVCLLCSALPSHRPPHGLYDPGMEKTASFPPSTQCSAPRSGDSTAPSPLLGSNKCTPLPKFTSHDGASQGSLSILQFK